MARIEKIVKIKIRKTYKASLKKRTKRLRRRSKNEFMTSNLKELTSGWSW